VSPGDHGLMVTSRVLCNSPVTNRPRLSVAGNRPHNYLSSFIQVQRTNSVAFSQLEGHIPSLRNCLEPFRSYRERVILMHQRRHLAGKHLARVLLGETAKQQCSSGLTEQKQLELGRHTLLRPCANYIKRMCFCQQ
jgi:hypothetical protein